MSKNVKSLVRSWKVPSIAGGGVDSRGWTHNRMISPNQNYGKSSHPLIDQTFVQNPQTLIEDFTDISP